LSPLYFKEGERLAFKSPFHSNLIIVIGTITIFLAGFLSLKLIKGKSLSKNI